MNNEKNKGKKVPVIKLFLRTAVGGYLIWTAYSLIPAFTKYQGLSRIAFIFFAFVFVAVGVSLAGVSIKKYLDKEFLMPGEDEDDEENEVDDTESKDL